MTPEFSILIPAYKEKKNIANTLQKLKEYFSSFPQTFEIVVVVDGCKETWDVAKNLADENTRVFYYVPNHGKGFALKFGITKVRGKYTIFFDAGMDFPCENICLIYYTLKVTGCPIVIGSKRHLASVIKYPWQRRVISIMGQILTKILLNLGVSDTQVGIKGFRTDVIKKIMAKTLVKRFAFDIEVLAIARLYGYKITEVPVKLLFNGMTSNINPKAILEVIMDVLAIFYRIKILRYYQKLKNDPRYEQHLEQSLDEVLGTDIKTSTS
jgi:glycosyltransferase involved in cell wall biosynthesis